MDDNSSLVGVTPGELRGGRGGGRGGRKFPVPWVSNIDCCRPPGKVGRFVCLTHLQISENKQLASNANGSISHTRTQMCTFTSCSSYLA